MKFILMIVLSIASMFTWASEEIISIEKFDHDPSVSTYMILAMNNKWGEGAGSGSTYKISREKSNNNLNSLEIFYDFPSEKRDVMMIMFKKNYIKEKNLEFFVYDANLEFWFYGDNSENILMVKYLNQDSNYERRISINWNGWKLISIPLKEGNFGVEGFCLQDKEESYKGSGTLYLNNIYCLERKPKEALELAKIKHLIKVNQVGYEPKSKKIAFLGIPGEANTNIATAIKTDTASVIDENGNIAFQGKIPDLKYDRLSGDWVGEIDFSSLQKTGTYRVIAGGAYCSYPFKIGSDVYRKLFRDSCRTLYLWRCGTAINDEDNHFNRRACHLNDKFNESGNTDLPQTIDAVGGWHDAADFHKNAIAHGLVNGELLQAYEIMPSKFQGDNWGIPESGNNTPDILDEVKWGMTWLLKIQLRDGSVPNSVEWINKSLSRAEDDKNLRYLDKAGLKSTEIFCAAAAKTAYVMKKIDPEFANRCELAAIKSWNFIEETRKKQLWFNSGRYESGNGGYKGAYFWAAGEMFRLTGQSKYSFIIKDL
ncbi:MAG: glycoside hydrolase family 9 protein, partial [Lentisphaerota bacterium]